MPDTFDLKTILYKTYLLTIFVFTSFSGVQGLSLNEFVRTNTSGVVDEDNEYSPWLEIHNSSGSSKILLGYGLTTDTSDPFHYIFPTCPLKTDQYRLFYVSGKDDIIKIEHFTNV